ncbi:tetratricopeptide repeat protein [Calditerrivibrio sp.]|uniref:tetratricopeptide repeat protein n=1 Tax=Calditerrivibrio sp. TaxID=2792612 RepID=UPI003D11CB61
MVDKLKIYLIFLIILITEYSYAAKVSYLKNIRYNEYDNYTRIVLDLSRLNDFTKNTKNGVLTILINNTVMEKSLKIPKIRNLKIVNTKDRKLILTIKINDDQEKIFKLNQPDRIVVDIERKDNNTIGNKNNKAPDNEIIKTTTNKKVSKNIDFKNSSTKIDEELLKISLSIFLQSNDIKNAYKITKYALNIFPDSIYWHEQMIKIAYWNGELDDAHTSMLYLFKNKKNLSRDFYKNLYSLSVVTGDYYTIVKLLKDEIEKGNYEKLNEYIYISTELLGDLDDTVKFIKKLYQRTPLNIKITLTKHLLRINYNLKNLDNSIDILENYIKQSYPLDSEIAQIGSNLYFIKKEYDKSLNILKTTMPNIPDNDTDFWRQLSDIAQFLNDKNTALLASLKLYKTGSATEVDYERIADYAGEADLKEQILMDAWLKFNKNYHAYRYLDLLIKSKKNKEAEDFIEKNLNRLSDYTPFMLLSINYYLSVNNYKNVKMLYKTLLARIDSNYIKESFIWFLIDSKDSEVSKYISNWSELTNKIPSLNLAYASYFSSVQKYKISLYYLKKYFKFKGESPELLLLYADILQASGKDEEANNIRYKAFVKFNHELNINTDSLKDKNKIISLLKFTLHYKSGEEFLSLLQKYSTFLNPQDRSELLLLYTLKNNQQEYTAYLKRKYSYSQPWIDLNVALNSYDQIEIYDILYKNLDSLPNRDSVESANIVGDKKIANQIAFDSLDENYPFNAPILSEQRSEDSDLYKQFRDLTNQYSDIFTYENSLGSNSDIRFFRNKIYLKNHLYKGFYSNLEFSNLKPSSRSDTKIKNLPSNVNSFNLKLSKEINNISNFNISFGFNDGLEYYNNFGAGFDYYIKNNTTVSANFNYHKNMEENSFLLLGGMKNEILIQIRHNITNKHLISGSYSYNKFYSQDNKFLGTSNNIYGEYDFKLREGYPDILWKNFVSYGEYSESSISNNSSILKLSPYENPRFLPETFTELGTSLSVGESNVYGYTRVIRPFASSGISYNSKSNLNYNFSLGLGGHIFNQDHLSIKLNLSTNSKNNADVTKSLDLIYRLFF